MCRVKRQAPMWGCSQNKLDHKLVVNSNPTFWECPPLMGFTQIVEIGMNIIMNLNRPMSLGVRKESEGFL
jgi:hypothetical protein